MSQAPNELRRNNTSSVPCIRLRVRRTRTGLLRKFIDVTWRGRGMPRGGTSFPADVAPVLATERAMARREEALGCTLFTESPRTIWRRLRAGAGL
jgi:hypothetical protein